MFYKRITIFSGHYGSGKTNLAVNYAIWLKNQVEKVVVCDLDIVNPFFRTKDFSGILDKHGVNLITSIYADTNIEAPGIPPNAQMIFDNKNLHAVIDVGGDDKGALILGRYSKLINQDDYEMLMVVNKYRPLSDNIQKLTEIKNEIEMSAKIKFTGIVNNSNLGNQTQKSDITKSSMFAKELSKTINLPIKMTAVSENILKQNSIDINNSLQGQDVFPVKIYEKEKWMV